MAEQKIPKVTSKELADYINKRLLEHNEYVTMDGILKNFLKSNANAREYVNSVADEYKGYKHDSEHDYEIFKVACKDVIKKAKQRLKAALEAFGYNDFDTEGKKFRYPDGIKFDPMSEDASKKVKLDRSQIIYKYQQKLLKRLDLAIKEKNVVTFDYYPSYDSDLHNVIFHPHYKIEFNGRIFVFGFETISTKSGEASRYCGEHQQGSIAIDRIFSDDINVVKGIKFIEPVVDYSTYFNDIIGVSHVPGEPRQLITIRTHSSYIHGLLLTRMMHPSQVETKKFDGTSGEFTIDVCYNKELLGALFHFESNIEVVSPAGIRDRVAEEVKRMYERYK